MSDNDETKTPLLADGLEDAFIGSIYSTVLGAELAVYDIDKCIAIYVSEGMSEEEALEFFNFNVACAYAGPMTPLFLQKQSLADFDNNYL